MFNRWRAARIRTLAVILVSLVITGVSIAQVIQHLQPGTSHIRITSQVIKRDRTGANRITASSLYNKSVSRYAIGNSVYRCTLIGNRRTLPRGSEFCNAIFRLPLGQIVATGIRSSPVFFRLAIVGGTGVYKNIGGEVEVITTKLVPHKEKLVFTVIAFSEGR